MGTVDPKVKHTWAFVAVLAVVATMLLPAASLQAQAGETCGGFAATIIGTEDSDVLLGTDGRDVIVGLGGNDIIRGFGGADVICGGNGRDTLFGGRGNDVLYGGKKNDNVKGDGGKDLLFGNEGNDRVIGGAGADVLEGGAGIRDLLIGKGGPDTCVDRQSTTRTATCETTQIPEPAPNITRGLPLGNFQLGHQTKTITEPGTWRWAEDFYGLRGIDAIVERSTCGVPHNYVVGHNAGDMAEYLMKLGEDQDHVANRLVVRGVSSGPGPVEFNVYIDGVLRATSAWTGGSETNSEVEVHLPGIPFGVHAVAIEFATDLYDPSRGEDRNMWLDGLFVRGPGGPDQPPNVGFLGVSNSSGHVPFTVSSEAFVDSSDGDGLQFRWEFGDGMKSSTTGAVSCHTYYAPGDYQHKVMVTDTNGRTAERETTISVSPGSAANSWTQDEFVIGALDEPKLQNVDFSRFVFDQSDFDALQRLSDAHFNLIKSGNHNFGGRRTALENYARARYLLEYAEMIGGLQFTLKDPTDTATGVLDSKPFEPPDAPIHLLSAYGPSANVQDKYRQWEDLHIRESQRDLIMGYNLGDEPIGFPWSGPQEQIKGWTDLVAQSDSSKLAWVNLLTNSEMPLIAGCGEHDYACTKEAYEQYLEPYVAMSGLGVISATDYYQYDPLASCGAESLDNWFWLSKQVLATTLADGADAGEAKPYWAIVRANEDFPGEISSTRRMEDYRHRVNSNLIYGAKGVLWFTYQKLGGFGDSMFENPAIYDIVRSLNAGLQRMGPTLMELEWQATAHSSDLNNEYRASKQTGVWRCSGVESNLETVTDATPVIDKISTRLGEERDFAVGIFEHADSGQPHLMVFNKARTAADPSQSRVGLSLREASMVEQFNPTTGTWETMTDAPTTSLLVDLDRSELALLRLTPPLRILTVGDSITNRYGLDELNSAGTALTGPGHASLGSSYRCLYWQKVLERYPEANFRFVGPVAANQPGDSVAVATHVSDRPNGPIETVPACETPPGAAPPTDFVNARAAWGGHQIGEIREHLLAVDDIAFDVAIVHVGTNNVFGDRLSEIHEPGSVVELDPWPAQTFRGWDAAWAESTLDDLRSLLADLHRMSPHARIIVVQLPGCDPNGLYGSACNLIPDVNNLISTATAFEPLGFRVFGVHPAPLGIPRDVRRYLNEDYIDEDSNLDGSVTLDEVTLDGVHPNSHGNEVLAEHIFEAVDLVLHSTGHPFVG